MPDFTDWQGQAPKELARLPLKDQLARYRQRIEVSRKYRRDEGFDAVWEDSLNLYRGKHFTEVLGFEDQVAVNLAFSTINVIVPSVAVNYPKITVQARSKEDDAKAAIAEAVVNYWWKHHDIKPEFQRAVKDMLIFGHGWIKIGYRYLEGERERDPDELQAEFMDLKTQVSEAALQDPTTAGLLPTEDEIASGLETIESFPVEDRPFVERVSPFDVFVDPEATCVGDLKWVAQKVVRDLEEVRRDQRYEAGARKKVRPDATVNRSWLDTEPTSRKYGDDIKRVTLWEFYDVQRGTMCVFAEQGEAFLVKPMDMPYAYGIPFVMVRNYDVPDQFYPIGELEMLRPLQQELNKTRSQMMNFRKKEARKYLYRRSAFGPQGVEALQSERDNTMVPVEVDDPLGDLVRPLEQSPLSPQMYQHSETIEADFDRVSGINEYMRGALPEIRRTATEASIIQDAANARAADKLAIVEGAISEVAQRLIQLAQQYMSDEQVVRVVGSMGQVMWAPFTPEDIKGEFDFEVEGGSTQPRNDTFRRQQAQQMLGALGPFIGQWLDPTALLAWVLREGFGIKNPEQFLTNPMEMQMMMGGMVPPEEGGGAPPPGGGETEGPPPDQEGTPPPNGGMAGLLQQLQGQVGLTPGIGGGALGPGAG